METPKSNPIQPLTIKKYANRRFYDTSRGQHVTLTDIHDLIAAGHNVTILDSRSGDDITNALLTQILLERDTAKLALFPANILHEMIRTQQQFLGGVLEQFFAQFLAAQRSSQERWSNFLKGSLGLQAPLPPNPLEWTRTWMDSLLRGSAPPPPRIESQGNEKGTNDNSEVEELRVQIQALARQIEILQREKSGQPPSD